jgi:cytochrome bd-type quinol oxidase subunit 2
VNFLERQLENPVRFARIKRWFYAGLAVVALAEIILPRIFHGSESHFSFEDFPAWGSLYGLVSCVAIVLVSKLIGKLWLMRREDYYDR